MGERHDPPPGRCLPRQRRLCGADPARDVHTDAPPGARALVRLGVRQGVLVHHPLRRRGGGAEGLAHLLIEDRGDALEDLDPDQIEARKSMLDTDPPKHSSLRAIVNKGFTPRAVAAYEELLRTLTRQILDEALPQTEFDFVEEVAKQLPIQV